MKNKFLALVISCSALTGFSQAPYTVSYDQLKEFEGLYEYINKTTLRIAASPRDTLLYAVINQSRYKLMPAEKDLFLNATKDKVRFVRNASAAISGYIVGKDTFKLISKNVYFPVSLWYPRPGAKNFRYQYQKPQDISDGLPTADIAASGADVQLLTEMMNKIVDETYANIHSVLILKDGKLVFEEYFYQFDRDSLHELRSATKSFVSALAGIAIDKGLIKSKNEKVVRYFPEYAIKNKTEAKERITIEHLLSNQSGLDCDINNDKSEGNETRMNYSDDWVKFTLDLPMIDTPGGKAMYCSGNSITLGRILEKTTKQPLSEFARQHLFAPMGIQKYSWRFKPDRSSAEDFCQLYLRPRDMAKLGLLYLNKGKWKDKQLVSSQWVEESLSKHSTIEGVNYGYLWWIKYFDADGVRYWGKGAQGNGGQRIYLWEEQDLIVVITGGSYNTQSFSDELIRKHILPAFNRK